MMVMKFCSGGLLKNYVACIVKQTAMLEVEFDDEEEHYEQQNDNNNNNDTTNK